MDEKLMKNLIVVIDDDNNLRNMLDIVLKKEGYDVISFNNGYEFLKQLKRLKPVLVISDIKMPDINGIDLLRHIKDVKYDLPVIMITAYKSTSDAVEAMKFGAEDYIIKPFDIDELLKRVKKAIETKKLKQENISLKAELGRERYYRIIGETKSMKEIFELVDSIAQTDSTVLITGESGTGKELIAREIHRKSNRKDENFVSINCGALPENLLESELFGYVKGAFTDAYKDKQGLFEVAHKGTLFLDEIAEMSQNMQVKLLRAIQEKRIRRLGDGEEKDVDVRIISATNKDLFKELQNNNFREDLFYRLNVISIYLPPLRERVEDIPLLMEHFLSVFNKKFNKNIKGFTREVYELFKTYKWYGNVRELENFIERAVALEKGDMINIGSLPKEIRQNGVMLRKSDDSFVELMINDDFNFTEYIDNISKKVILKALEISGNNLTEASRLLKISYRSIRYYVKKFGLK